MERHGNLADGADEWEHLKNRFQKENSVLDNLDFGYLAYLKGDMSLRYYGLCQCELCWRSKNGMCRGG